MIQKKETRTQKTFQYLSNKWYFLNSLLHKLLESYGKFKNTISQTFDWKIMDSKGFLSVPNGWCWNLTFDLWLVHQAQSLDISLYHATQYHEHAPASSEHGSNHYHGYPICWRFSIAPLQVLLLKCIKYELVLNACSSREICKTYLGLLNERWSRQVDLTKYAMWKSCRVTIVLRLHFVDKFFSAMFLVTNEAQCELWFSLIFFNRLINEE